MNKSKELNNMAEDLKALHTKYTGNENPYESNHHVYYGNLKTNYGFTRPIGCDGSRAIYYQLLRVCNKCGATPKEAFSYLPSHCNRSHFYNSGLVKKENGLWKTTQYGYEYVKTVESWEAKFKVLRDAGL